MKPLLVVFFLLGSFLVTRVHAAPAKDIFAENVRTTEPLSPEEEREKFHLPPGFKIQLVAAEPDLRKPMNMAFDSVGRLWVTESREYPFAATNDATARDTIRIFSNFDDNGRAQKVTTFATNLNIPIGLYPFRSVSTNAANPNDRKLTWKCVVWSIPNIYLLEDTDGDGIADKKTLLYGPFDTTRDTHGNQASFRRGLDGWIYATHGFNNQSRVAGKDGHEIFLPSGNIYRFKLDGSRIEHWTHGQVNPFGLCFDPLGNLYSADCHSSPIYQLLRGAHYPSFGRPHDGLGFGPTTIQHSHGSTAIAGIVYISDPEWSAHFQNNIFIGNVMTSRINRDEINFTGSTSKGTEMPDFLSTDDPWFRPVDLQFGPDGALWVADFYNRIIGHYEVPLLHPGRDRERGRIWRIVPPLGADLDRLAVFPPNESVRLLDSPFGPDSPIAELASLNPVRRSLALAEYSRFPVTPLVEGLRAALRNKLSRGTGAGRPHLRTAALWLLERGGQLDEESWLLALKDKHEIVRVQALRVLTERGLQAAAGAPSNARPDPGALPPVPSDARRSALLAAARAALDDDSAFVRRAAADALAANPHPDNLNPLLALQDRTNDNDPHLHHVIRLALREQLRQPGAFARLTTQPHSAADSRAFATVAGSVTNAEAASFLLKHVQSHAEPPEVLARYITHAARYAPDAELGTVAALAKKQFAADLDTQAALFKALQEGLAARGGALPPDLRAWGTDLAGQLLAPAAQPATWTYVPLNADKPGPNPFAFEERNCADGQRTRLMSSFPHGETLTGVLRSPVFVLPKQLSFYLCGHDGFPGQPAGGKNHVRLRLVSDTDKADTGLCPTASDSLSLHRMRGEGWGEGFQATALAAPPLIRPAATFSPPPRKGEGERPAALGHPQPDLTPQRPASLPLPLGEGSCSAARGASRVEAELRWAEEGLWRPASLFLPAGEGRDEGEGIHNSEAYGVRCDGKGARPEESVDRPVGKVSRPEETVHRPEETMCLDSREAVPTGREAVPTGREVIPTGREAIPTGREAIPTGREAVPTGREAVPTGREAVPTRLAAAKATGALPKGVVREAKVPRNDTAQKITWDLGDLAGKRAVIEVTDGDEGKAYAWLAFGRFVPALPELVLQDTQGIGKRQVLGADLARVLLLDREPAIVAAVAKLFAETEDRTVRAAAGRAWLALEPEQADHALTPVLRDAKEPEAVRAELAVQFGQLGLNAPLVAALTNAPTRLQTKFAVALLANGSGAEQLLAAAEAGRVPARLLQDRTLADRLGASPARDAKARLAALTKNLPPADAAVQLAIEARRKGFAPQQASAARGAAVFTKACAVCHQLGGQGALVGPQLDGIGGRGLERLLEDILDPNRNVDKAFRTTVYVLKDGETVSGLARREEGGAFIYALANGQEARVAKADVKERRETETSLMPANFAEALTAAELNDLLAFLLEHKAR